MNILFDQINNNFYDTSQSLGFLLGYTKFVSYAIFMLGSGILKIAWRLIVSGPLWYIQIFTSTYLYI